MSAAGTWTLTLTTPIGEQKGTLALTENGGVLSGRMTAEGGNSTEIKDGKLTGNQVSWKADIKNPMPLTLEFQATVEGDAIKGTVNTVMGSWPFSGSRSA